MDARTAALTCAALTAFAANSLLCRGALGPRLADAATFTTVRLASGALVLALLARASGARGGRGSWASAAALFAYAIAFSFAYLRIPAGVGALVLFAAVQATMIGSELASGVRPRPGEWAGLAISMAGLVALTRPGAGGADPLGVALMAGAGVAWGVYSLRGRGVADPVGVTADNFARSVPLAALVSLAEVPRFHATAAGIGLAAGSGAVASGLGYVIWYAALRGLTATRAAIVQLAVPLLAAVGGVLLLREAVTLRLFLAGAAILGGIALAVASRRR